MAYNGRRAPNVLGYIANLNTIPSEQDLQAQAEDNFNLEDDLAMFTNTNFFDFDLGQNTDLQATGFEIDGYGSVKQETSAIKPVDYTGAGDFNFGDFNNFNQTPGSFSGESVTNTLPPIQTGVYPGSSTAGSPTSGILSSQVAQKRKADSHDSIEEQSRAAAEEDKRRRNTAASARFRIKKKQREQALEKSAKEMSDKVAALEGKINQLETENKWLKNLITEKHETKENIAALWKKYSNDKGSPERIEGEPKRGVGTS